MNSKLHKITVIVDNSFIVYCGEIVLFDWNKKIKIFGVKENIGDLLQANAKRTNSNSFQVEGSILEDDTYLTLDHHLYVIDLTECQSISITSYFVPKEKVLS